MDSGRFIISLDFELHWGGAEKWDLYDRREYFETARESIPLVLNMFGKYKIHATWATVGFLFAKDKRQLLEFLPKKKPIYSSNELSYYALIDNEVVGADEVIDPYHFGYSLIKQIVKTPNQELASHTFSHYYCNEEGQTIEDFEADLNAAQKIARENFNIELMSLVFPRNQLNEDYLKVIGTAGFKVVRSNPNVWFWNNPLKFAPLLRAIDTLLPISKTVCFDANSIRKGEPVILLPASRFLRPFSAKERLFQKRKLNRILSEMTFAAKQKKCYHLWWHPHNFGSNLDENLRYLEAILLHYTTLNEKYNFESKSMIEMYS